MEDKNTKQESLIVSSFRINEVVLYIFIFASMSCSLGNKVNDDSTAYSSLKEQPSTGGNIEGYCVLEYTVTEYGTTKDIKVYDCPYEHFVKTAIEAAKKFTYKPKIVDGSPVEVRGVKNKFTFVLSKD